MRKVRARKRLPIISHRRLNLHELASRKRHFESTLIAMKDLTTRSVKGVNTDPVWFFEQALGFKLTAYQEQLVHLFEENQFVAARWCRQSGKSSTVSGLLLHYALTHAGCHIAVIGPSWRQTKLNIQRISRFLSRLPTQSYLKPQRTKLIVNDSTIEAFPNNPSTIRGQTLDVIWWDEVNFTADDQDLYDAMLFAISTISDSKLVCTSTPWNTDSLFWRMCNDENFGEFKVSHVTYEQAMEPNGPLKPNIIEKIKKQFGEDSERWRREMMAEWAEDEDVWLPQSMVVSCVGTVKNCEEDLQPWDPEKGYRGDLFGGLDLAQVRDYCVFSVVERRNDRLFLRHLKIFSQPTKYAHVLGYVKALQDRWGGFEKIRVDSTKDGPSIISDMEDAGIENAEGVTFSVPRKSEMANLLKQRMADQKLFFPLETWEKPYRSDICTELNVERYEHRKDGTMAFNHPNGTHDDVFWAVALGVFAVVPMKPVDLETIRFG